MTKPVSITVSLEADTTDIGHYVFTTSRGASGISVIVTADSDLGGGILNIATRPDGDTETTPEPLKDDADATAIAVGDQASYVIRGNMQVYVTLTGATDPDVTVFISES